jgi:hypothetical protein
MFAFRDELDGTGSPQPPAGPVTARDEPTDAERADLNRANSYVAQARSLVESRRPQNVEAVIAEATHRLIGVREVFRAPLLAQIDVIRLDLAAAVAGERQRRVAEELDRHLDSAGYAIEVRPFDAATALLRVHARLSHVDTRDALPDGTIDGYRSRIDFLARQLYTRVKADALGRALPLVEDIEDRLVADPFAGLDRRTANIVTGDLRTLKDRALTALSNVARLMIALGPLSLGSGPDPELDAVRERLDEADRRIAAASAAWDHAQGTVDFDPRSR